MEDQFVERHMISRPLPETSNRVTINQDRLSKIHALNEKLKSLNENESEINSYKHRINKNKTEIFHKKEEIPSDDLIEEMKQKYQIQLDLKQEIENLRRQINDSKMQIAKYDQTKAFLSLLIEKALNLYYPNLAAGGNIHEKIVQSVEQDNSFEYGNKLLDEIKKKT